MQINSKDHPKQPIINQRNNKTGNIMIYLKALFYLKASTCNSIILILTNVDYVQTAPQILSKC